LDTALDFDLLNFERLTKAELKKNIETEGVEIYVRKES